MVTAIEWSSKKRCTSLGSRSAKNPLQSKFLCDCQVLAFL